MPLFPIFPFSFALTALTFHFISWIEQNISLNWNFLGSYPVTQAIGLKHVKTRRRKRTVVKYSGSMALSCFHTTRRSKANPSVTLKDSSLEEDILFKNQLWNSIKLLISQLQRKERGKSFSLERWFYSPFKCLVTNYLYYNIHIRRLTSMHCPTFLFSPHTCISLSPSSHNLMLIHKSHYSHLPKQPGRFSYPHLLWQFLSFMVHLVDISRRCFWENILKSPWLCAWSQPLALVV